LRSIGRKQVVVAATQSQVANPTRSFIDGLQGEWSNFTLWTTTLVGDIPLSKKISNYFI